METATGALPFLPPVWDDGVGSGVRGRRAITNTRHIAAVTALLAAAVCSTARADTLFVHPCPPPSCCTVHFPAGCDDLECEAIVCEIEPLSLPKIPYFRLCKDLRLQAEQGNRGYGCRDDRLAQVVQRLVPPLPSIARRRELGASAPAHCAPAVCEATEAPAPGSGLLDLAVSCLPRLAILAHHRSA